MFSARDDAFRITSYKVFKFNTDVSETGRDKDWREMAAHSGSRYRPLGLNALEFLTSSRSSLVGSIVIPRKDLLAPQRQAQNSEKLRISSHYFQECPGRQIGIAWGRRWQTPSRSRQPQPAPTIMHVAPFEGVDVHPSQGRIAHYAAG
jgi:hypothetical protein